jgi:hypothetical protein
VTPVCPRTTDDRLVRYFLDRYGLNLLVIPRADVRVGSLYLSPDGRRVSAPIAVETFLKPRPRLPAPHRGERMADLAGTTSDAVTSRAGLGLLQGFLTALGAAGVLDRVKAEYRRKRVRALRFRVTGATRDWVDSGALGDALQGCRVRVDHPLWAERQRYYIVSSVVRSSSLVVVAHASAADVVDLDIDALAAITGSAGLDVERTGEGAVRYRGLRRLAFAVELFELVHDRAAGGLRLRAPTAYVATRKTGVGHATGHAPERAFPGGASGPAFLVEA